MKTPEIGFISRAMINTVSTQYTIREVAIWLSNLEQGRIICEKRENNGTLLFILDKRFIKLTSFLTPSNNFSSSNHLYSAYLAALLFCLSFGIFENLELPLMVVWYNVGDNTESAQIWQSRRGLNLVRFQYIYFLSNFMIVCALCIVK